MIELILAGVGIVSTVSAYMVGRSHAGRVVESAIRHGFETAVARVDSFKKEIPVALGKIGAQTEPVVELVVLPAAKQLPGGNGMRGALIRAARLLEDGTGMTNGPKVTEGRALS
jgi:hypothetical protein